MTRTTLTHWPELAAPRWRSASRLTLAMLLHAASLALAHLAAKLSLTDRRKPGAPVLEFHAEAGAPEGALYVDGELIGFLPGVNRL
jgi:hypothetical protein